MPSDENTDFTMCSGSGPTVLTNSTRRASSAAIAFFALSLVGGGEATTSPRMVVSFDRTAALVIRSDALLSTW